MSENCTSRGIPVPTFWQCLIATGAFGAIWFLWPEIREPEVNDPVVEAFDNLRSVEAIAGSGPAGVPELIAALASPNFRFRRNVLIALRPMGPEAVEALPAIRERLVDADGQVRWLALEAYWHIRSDPEDVAAIAAPMLGDPEADVRESACKILESIGPQSIRPILDALRSDARDLRIPALTVLRRIGWDAPSPQIDEVLREQSNDPEVRLEAMRTLAMWSQPTSGEIRELLQHADAADRLRNDPRAEPGPRETALRAINRLGPAAAENVDDLLQILAECRQNRRQWALALAALREMKPDPRVASPTLLQLAKEGTDDCWIDVGWTLLAIGGDAEQVIGIAVPHLLTGNTDQSFHAGRLCASASPEEARRQVSQLLPLLTPENLVHQRQALDAVWGLAPAGQEAIPALTKLLECSQPHLASVAAKALRDIGPQAASAVPTLLAQLGRGTAAHDHWTRHTFFQVIGTMGSASRSAIPALLAELNDAPLSRPLNTTRAEGHAGVVMTALVRIGDSSPAVLAAIQRHLTNEDGQLQRLSLRALTQLSPESPEVRAIYKKWLHDLSMPQERLGHILEISQLAGDRQEFVVLLTDLLFDDSPEIRKSAAWTLGTMGSQAQLALPALKSIQGNWRDSLYPSRNWRLEVIPDDRHGQLEKERWDDRAMSAAKSPPFLQKSVQQVVRDAIAKIEGNADESLSN
ncbi:MAG: HEAT repeat domain-containing protein [Planctomycetes bacterium]|nr:HEAT repeat domain-containing protein [Planctomycetota bacterium]